MSLSKSWRIAAPDACVAPQKDRDGPVDAIDLGALVNEPPGPPEPSVMELAGRALHDAQYRTRLSLVKLS